MLPHAVRPVVVAQFVVLIMAVILVIGAVACERTDEAGPPTRPTAPPASTSVPEDTSEGSISLATPDEAASLDGSTTVEGTIAAEPGVTPPALLPGTAEPTAPAVRSGTTPESEGPPPTEEPTSPTQTEASPTDTPVPPTDTPVPPTNTPEPPAPPTGNRIGQSAPDFEVTTIDGATKSLTDYKQGNKAVVLYFFSST